MRDAERHPQILPPCSAVCKRKCTENISDDLRETIHRSYWTMLPDERRLRIRTSVISKPRLNTCEGESRRGQTLEYKLQDIQVCKTFFLTTLGYKPNNKPITTALISLDEDGQTVRRMPLDNDSVRDIILQPAPDRRGRHPPPNKLDVSVIRNHIESFRPCAPHYRRLHAPLRRYFPGDITPTIMHKDFEENSFKCSIQIYRRTIRQMNIAFTTLGHEECETCGAHTFHECSNIEDADETCGNCSSHREHLQRKNEARRDYDADGAISEDGIVIAAADMQKVIMLPRMEGYKTYMFTQRLVVFHETFAPLRG